MPFAYCMPMRSALREVRDLEHPPAAVKLVIDATLMLLNEPTDLGNARRLLSEPHFQHRLRDFDPSSVSAETWERVRQPLQFILGAHHGGGSNAAAVEQFLAWHRAVAAAAGQAFPDVPVGTERSVDVAHGARVTARRPATRGDGFAAAQA